MNIHYRLSIRVYVIHNTSVVHICCMCCILVIYCVYIYVCLYLLIFALLKGGNKEQRFHMVNTGSYVNGCVKMFILSFCQTRIVLQSSIMELMSLIQVQ